MADRQYDNEKTGALFRNARKTQDKQPDHNGNCTIEGVEYWISAWVKESKKDGSKFFSLAFTPKNTDGMDQRPASERQTQQPVAPTEDIPFGWLIGIATALAASGGNWIA
jgi:hypothetical protein